MKHLLAIIPLIVLAILSFSLFLYQSGSGKLTDVLGKPALKEGSTVLDFNRKTIEEVHISSREQTERYTRFNKSDSASDFGWIREEKDGTTRADYRKVEKLLFLLESATVINELQERPSNQHYKFTLFSSTGGISESQETTITLHNTLPRYTGVEPLLPVFSVTKDGRTYACTSELDEPFPLPTAENLTDKRPFYFHPNYLKELSYQTASSEVTLKKSQHIDQWEITAPIQLRTDPKKVKSLISKLYTLEASEIKKEDLKPDHLSQSISIKSSVNSLADQTVFLDQDRKTAYNADSKLLYTFADPQALTSVTPKIDNLRARNLLEVDLGNISSILLQSKSQSYPVSLTIQKGPAGSPRWMYQTSNRWNPADEINVGALITALTKDQVDGFSLENFQPSAEPEKSITLFLKEGENIHFNLFRKNETYLIQQEGHSQSAILSPTHYHKIKTRPEEWQIKKLWDFSPISLRGFQRKIKGRPVENYSYNYNLEEWKGQIGNQRIDEEFDHVTANSFLDFLETIYVEKWIPPSDPLVQNISPLPVLQLITLSEEFSNLGDSLGIKSSTLTVLPKKSPEGLFLIKLEIDNTPPQFGLLKEEVARRLGTAMVYQD